MTDQERVINGLEHCRRGHIGCQQECPYTSDFGCRSQLADDALELLKEQEPKSVLSNRVCESDPCRYVRKGFCPKCHQEVEWLLNRSYCGFCGQAVKRNA